MINRFVSSKKNDSIKFSSIGYDGYLSILQYVDCVLGNSSSGLIEAPSLKIPTINIGDRQKGRPKANSVVDCKPKRNYITNSIKKICTKKFRNSLKRVNNPYGYKNTTNKIYNIIKKTKIPNNLKKSFYNL